MLHSNSNTPSPVEIESRAAALAAQFPQLSPSRIKRAVSIASLPGTIIETAPGIFAVKSESNPLGSYIVDTHAKTCSCPDAGHGHVCKHRLAVGLWADWRQAAPAAATAQAPAQAEQPAQEARIIACYDPLGIDVEIEFVSSREYSEREGVPQTVVFCGIDGAKIFGHETHGTCTPAQLSNYRRQVEGQPAQQLRRSRVIGPSEPSAAWKATGNPEDTWMQRHPKALTTWRKADNE